MCICFQFGASTSFLYISYICHAHSFSCTPLYATYTIYCVCCTRLSDHGLAGWMCADFISAWECTWNGTRTALVPFCSHFLALICPQQSPDIHQEHTKRQKWCNSHISRLWRHIGELRAYNGYRAQGCCKWDTLS
jgi:hypothetical protein